MQITEFLTPNGRSNTEYGRVNNMEWLALEKQRIEKGTGKSCIFKFDHLCSGQVVVALYYKTRQYAKV